MTIDPVYTGQEISGQRVQEVIFDETTEYV